MTCIYTYTHVHITTYTCIYIVHVTCMLSRKKPTAPTAADNMARAREEYTFLRCCFVALFLQQKTAIHTLTKHVPVMYMYIIQGFIQKGVNCTLKDSYNVHTRTNHLKEHRISTPEKNVVERPSVHVHVY